MALKDLVFRDFSGGMNTRDGASELSPEEFPYSLNVTIDERGYLQKRLGYVDRFGSQIGTGRVKNLFYWSTQNKLVSQIGSSLHLDGSIAFHTFTTADRCGMCEFAGNLFFIHPVDGCFTYTGSGSAAAITSSPHGNACATWQNKVWTNDVTAPPRLWRSNVGTTTFDAALGWIDLREKDSAQLVAFAGASGIDVAGRPGLLVFKEDSAYRINDPSTGAYTTIDPSIGCGSSIGAISAYGRTYAISSRGIYSTDGLNPMREESKLVENLFQKNQINQTRADLYCAGRYQDRLYFSLPRAGETENSFELELNPEQKWIVSHSKAAAAYATFGRGVTDMVFGAPHVDGRIYTSHTGGSDAGVAITSEFHTRWAEPSDGRKARLRRARFVGLGVFDAQAVKDYEDTGELGTMHITIEPEGFLYDDPSSIYDAPGVTYATPSFQSYQDFYSIGVVRAVQVRITETSSLTQVGATVAGGTAAQEIGAWTLAYISFLAIDLGQT